MHDIYHDIISVQTNKTKCTDKQDAPPHKAGASLVGAAEARRRCLLSAGAHESLAQYHLTNAAEHFHTQGQRRELALCYPFIF